MLHSLDAIVFDLDGTLIASHDLIARTVNRVLVGRGLAEVDPELVHAQTGRPLLTIFEAVLPTAHEASAPTCVEAYREIFDREVIPAVEPIPGARELIASLPPSLPLGIATGRLTSTAVQMLARCELTDYFGVVLGSELAGRPKPAADLLLLVLQQLGGIDPRRVLVVGDSIVDVGMARAAGAYACAVTWGAQSRSTLLEAEPHWCIDTWSELTDLLQG